MNEVQTGAVAASPVETPPPTIFDFADFGSYLREALEHKRQVTPGFSLRALAKRLRCSPSLLAMISRGERQPRLDLVMELCTVFKLSKKECAYAEVLAGFHRAKSAAAKKRYAETLHTLKPRNEDLLITLDVFKLMSDWYHLTIVELTQLPGFNEDPQVLASLLGPTVSPAMVVESIKLVTRLGLLVRDERGRLRKASRRLQTPRGGTPSSAVRTYHKQILARGIQAIDRGPTNERHFSTSTIELPRSLVPEVIERILAFREELLTFISTRNATSEEVYHLGVQFFRATVEPAFVEARPATRS